MFLPFIVIFREVLEIALIVSLMFVATKGLPGRGKWIGVGFLLGILGSVLIAVFIEGISNFANGLGQELFNAFIALAASILIGWTAIWVGTHGKQISHHIKQKGKQVVDGELPVKTLVIIIMLAVLREGSEIVLFLYGMLLSGLSLSDLLLGTILGSLSGALLGGAIYFGMIKINTKYIFSITSWLLIFIAAGMAAIAGRFFVAAGYFSANSSILWDMSGILNEQSFFGQILHIFFGYSDSPMLIEVIFYSVFLAITIMIIKFPDFKSLKQD